MVKVRKCFSCKKYRSQGKQLFVADCDQKAWFCDDCVSEIVPNSNPLEKYLRSKSISYK